MRPTRLGHRHRSDEYEGEARRARGRSRGVAGEDAPAFVFTGACDTRNASAPAAVWCEYLTDPRPQPGIGEIFGPGIATRVAGLERGAVIVELRSCRHIPSEDTDFSPRAGFSSPNPEWRTTRVTTRRSIPGSRSSGATARAILPLSKRGAAPQVTGSQCPEGRLHSRRAGDIDVAPARCHRDARKSDAQEVVGCGRGASRVDLRHLVPSWPRDVSCGEKVWRLVWRMMRDAAAVGDHHCTSLQPVDDFEAEDPNSSHTRAARAERCNAAFSPSSGAIPSSAAGALERRARTALDPMFPDYQAHDMCAICERLVLLVGRGQR